MSDFFIGTILPWAGNWAPNGWLYCHGQQLSIQTYTALFSLIGTKYGGDGRTTFNLPNLQGRVLVGAPTITGAGQTVGAVWTPQTLTANIAHTHTASGTITATLKVLNDAPTTDVPTAATCIAKGKRNQGPSLVDSNLYTTATSPDPVDIGKVTLTPPTITGVANAGTATPASFVIQPPWLGLDYIICASEGTYPDFS